MEELKKVDPDVYAAISQELERETGHLQLIASENFASKAVLQAQGSVMTNKYAEGYPAKRYYGGCDVVDIVEKLAVERAKALFGAEHANVQPHSGSQANMAVYFSVLEPGDVIMAMESSHGGHLTHGSPANFSGMYYNIVTYGVDKETELIDHDVVRQVALKHRPKIIVAGASSYPRQLDFKGFRQICDEVGAYLMADVAHTAGLIAADLHPDPVPHADFVTCITHKTLRGARGGIIMCKERYADSIDKMVFPGTQGGPSMHVIAAKAVTFKEALAPEFKDYQKQVISNADRLGRELAEREYRLVSGGTDTHLVLLDLRDKDITGRQAQTVLGRAGITTNRNIIPFDPRSPAVASGIRLGTPAVTTQGMGEEEIATIAAFIDEALRHYDDENVLEKIRGKVLDLCRSFPPPGN